MAAKGYIPELRVQPSGFAGLLLQPHWASEKWIHLMIRRILGIVSLVFLVSCADTHQLVKETPNQRRLAVNDSVLIVAPEDGFYGADIYLGSGRMTAQTIYSAVAKRTRSATVQRSPQTFDDALQSASAGRHRFLIYPIILHWEDRATEWSMIPDKVEVKIEVVEVSSGEVISSAIVKGKSGLATFGGDHPQDLLPEPVEEFVSSLY